MWVIKRAESGEIVARSKNGVDWEFSDEDTQALFETILIEGVAKGRRVYVSGDARFEELFWDELESRGYDVVMVAPEAEKMEVKAMPKAILDKLPDEAKAIYERVYKESLERYEDDDDAEAKAAGSAMKAVKNAGYVKDEESGNWVKRKMHVAPMHFTKATMDEETGEMRFGATVSKFDLDDQGDEVTREFYQSAIMQVEKGLRPEPVMCVSHVDKGKADDDWAVSGSVVLYIDGEQPKAKGTIRDTPLGRAVFKAIRDDIAAGVPTDERARISMGFFADRSEPHPEGDGRRFLDGWVKHLAVTRVPVVKETAIVVKGEGDESKVTIRQDAESIIGKELAEKLLQKGEAGAAPEGLILKALEGTDQAQALLKQLAGMLGFEIDLSTLEENRDALGSEGTAPARAQPAEKGDMTTVDTFVDGFAANVKAALRMDGDRTAKFTALQQHLNEFGEGVQSLVKGDTPPSGDDIAGIVQAAVQQALAPIQQAVLELRAEVARVKGEAVEEGEPTRPGGPTAMDLRVAMTSPPIPPSGAHAGASRQAKARTASEIAWESTSPRY